MSLTITPEGDDTVHDGRATSAANPCPSCGSPRRVGKHGWTCARCALGTALDVAPMAGDDEAGEDAMGFAEAAPGRLFDHYELALGPGDRPVELGRGAMGVTYKAFDLNLRCPVALKVIHRHLLHEPSVRERFVREARAVAVLRHSNVAAVHHLGTRGDEWFFAMEFIEGETLDAVVRRRGPLGAAEALAVVTQVARALGAAERVGLVHRDIKPANLMLVNEPGTGVGPGPWLVKVIDFGVARSAAVAAAGGADLTGGLLVGTPSFASPEQLRGEATDFRSDLYSLGVTLWWALLGRTPFTGDSFQVVGQHLSKVPPFQELADAKVPAPVVALLQEMLEKKPTARPPTPAALLDALAGVAAALPSPAAAAVATQWKVRMRRRRRRWLPIALGTSLVGAGALVVTALRRETPRSPVAAPSSASLATAPGATAVVRSLAVLPFRRSGGGGETEALLADGLAEDVIARLSKLDGLKVISQASSGTLRDSARSPAEIAAQLGVRGLLLGRVRQGSDGTFAIHAELVDAPDGGRVIWSETYEHLRPADLALVQGRLSRDIATSLRLVLTPTKEAALTRPLTENALAYDRYLRGRAFHGRYAPEDLERAVEFYQKALELDPNFTAARAAMAETLAQQFNQSGNQTKLDQGFAAAREAVRLDPNLPESHRALGYLLYVEGREPECLQSCLRALALNPNYTTALTLAGAAWRNMGRLDEAIFSLRKAAARDPLNAREQIILGETLVLLDNDTDAEAAFRLALTLQPDHVSAHEALADIHLLRGEFAAAREELRIAQSLSTKRLYGLYLGATIELFDGQATAAEAAYRRLLAAGADRGLDFYEAVSARSALGLLRTRAGDMTEAETLLAEAAKSDEELIRQSPDRTKAIYDLAAVRAVQGRRDEALICLQQATAAGWCHYRATRRDPRFANLLADNRFQAQLNTWKDRVDRMRRSADLAP